VIGSLYRVMLLDEYLSTIEVSSVPGSHAIEDGELCGEALPRRSARNKWAETAEGRSDLVTGNAEE